MPKKFYKILFLVITLSYTSPGFAQSASYVPKEGGLSFRVDDNGILYQYTEYANLFNSYGKKFSFAMNLSREEFDNPGYVTSIKAIQDMGHLVMDHTPSHATNYFYTRYTPSDYIGLSGADHIVGTKVCISHEPIDTNINIHSGYADINDDVISFASSDYTIIRNGDGRYFYFPSIDQLVLVHNFKDGPKHGVFHDIWAEDLTLGQQQYSSLLYYTFTRDQVTLTPEGITLLVSESVKLFEFYNLDPPTIWIQPGGNFPVLKSTQVKSPLESLNFTGAATYYNEAEKVYNEYNPNDDRQFAFQWGDFIEDEMELSKIKEIIADGVAKHQVMINNIHWYSDDDWTSYMSKMTSLFEWTDANSIPIKPYDEWIDLLYTETADPYENIIPPLNVDKDNNGIPDGYGRLFYPNHQGLLEIDPTTPGPGENSYSIQSDQQWSDRFINIFGLGGIEKGKNEFSIWTRGAPGDSVEVFFSDPNVSNSTVSYKFPAETPIWEKQSLSKQGKTLTINDNQSVVDIDILCSDYVSGTVRIAGMSLFKIDAVETLEMNVISSIPSIAGDSILVEIIAKNDLGYPAVTSDEYEIILPGGTTELLSLGSLTFNQSAKDTIVVIDTTSGIINLSVRLANDISINTNIDITIAPAEPHHFNIISNSETVTIGSTKLIQVELYDLFSNKIPDKSITFATLNGNGKFSNSLPSISINTNSFGVAENLYTASTSIGEGFDSIIVSYETSVVDTIILPLDAAFISNFNFSVLSSLPASAGDTVKIEITAKDIFNNDVISSEAYALSADSASIEFLPSNLSQFSNSAKDTIGIKNTVIGDYNILAQLSSNSSIKDSILISIINSSPSSITNLTQFSSLTAGSEGVLQVVLADTFGNRISDSLLSLTALNGNGKFSNDLQIIPVTTNSFGIAENLYTSSSSIGIDTIEVSFKSIIFDTLFIHIKPGTISRLNLTPITSLPAFDGDSILVAVGALDEFNNPIDYSGNYTLSALGSSTAQFIPSSVFSFDNSSIDTLILKDSLAGSYKIFAQLESDPSISDTINVEVIYSEKLIDIKVFLAGAYHAVNNRMDDSLSNYVPLISPYSESPDTVTTLPFGGIVDWVLVTLRQDIDSQNPDINSAADFISKSAFIKTNGDIIDSQTQGSLGFQIPAGKYYILVNHRNHIPIISSNPISFR